ncbi:cell wall anchored protein [Dendryphion nanum]|uniref:Cell wall anchored protein n=1 Tax=Dendryphion nanum TaxID=256645 RepID=A0A9P9ICW9_9PLEO|nr:cell wall anchored protein [Dendryphion nanum]
MMFKIIAFWVFALVALSTHAQKHPLKDFCRLFGHQTTVVDRKQYIDGGFTNWSPLSAGSTNYTSTWLRAGNFDDLNEGFAQQKILAKNESTPSVHGGILWADSANKLIYQYGGEYGNQMPEDFKLWYYDIVYNTWNISQAETGDIKRASWGAGAVAQDKARGYYYGGFLSGSSVPGYSARVPLSTMIVYDMLANRFRNQTGPDQIPRAEGSMIYLPAGDSGLLVYFGGVEFPHGNSTARGVNMIDIFIYDIGNNLWYKQKASGEVPEQRRRFCAGATWTEDRSSYNIYLFGGASIGNGVGFGDVYVLSLPSFKWIKFWPNAEDSAGETFPHHSLSCDVIDNTQMIIMGGHFTNSTTNCDVPVVYGQHGLDLGRRNSLGAKWATYNASITKYQVPTEIAKVVGGGPSGGATLLTPTNGWEVRDLQTQFARAYTPTARDPTRHIPRETGKLPQPPASIDSNKSAVIGGAVGGSLGGILIAAVVGIFLIRRRRKQNRRSEYNPVIKHLGPASDFGGDVKSPPMSYAGSIHHARSIHRHESQSQPPSATWSKYSHGSAHPGSPEVGFSPADRPPQNGYYPPPPLPPNGRAPSRNFSLPTTPLEMPATRSPTSERFEMSGESSQKRPSSKRPPPVPVPPVPTIDPYFMLNPPPNAPESQRGKSPRSSPGPSSRSSPGPSLDPYFSRHPPRETSPSVASPTITAPSVI